MRVAICENNDIEQAHLIAAIKDWATERKTQVDILCYNNAEGFIVAWPEISFDLIFLDIQMKNMTGLQLAEYIRHSDKNMLIVFVTSLSQYVLKGYDVAALHYLIKPLLPEKLISVMDKAQSICKSRQKDILLVSNGVGIFKISFDSIFYIVMLSHTAEIHTDNGIFNLRKTAYELDKLLTSNFVRCHRSYIVNLLKADCVYKDSIILSNGVKLPISRNNSKKINEVYVRLYSKVV